MSKPTIIQVIKSVCLPLLVYKAMKTDKEISNKDLFQRYIIAGVIFTVLFVVGLIFLVSIILGIITHSDLIIE